MTFYNHIENVRTMAINLTHGEPWHGARDKASVFDSLDAARREYMQLQAENTKLRELVRWMYDRMDESCAVQYPYAPAPISYDRLMQALARARELGVEVNK